MKNNFKNYLIGCLTINIRRLAISFLMGKKKIPNKFGKMESQLRDLNP